MDFSDNIGHIIFDGWGYEDNAAQRENGRKNGLG
jgi:hypothetical protein